MSPMSKIKQIIALLYSFSIIWIYLLSISVFLLTDGSIKIISCAVVGFFCVVGYVDLGLNKRSDEYSYVFLNLMTTMYFLAILFFQYKAPFSILWAIAIVFDLLSFVFYKSVKERKNYLTQSISYLIVLSIGFIQFRCWEHLVHLIH